jgi:hypothetical protein
MATTNKAISKQHNPSGSQQQALLGAGVLQQQGLILVHPLHRRRQL